MKNKKENYVNVNGLIDILNLNVMSINDIKKLIDIAKLEGELYSQSDRDINLEIKILEKIKDFKSGFALSKKDWEKDPSVIKKAKSIIDFCNNDHSKAILLAREQIIPILGSDADITWIEDVIQEIKDIRDLYNNIDNKESCSMNNENIDLFDKDKEDIKKIINDLKKLFDILNKRFNN